MPDHITQMVCFRMPDHLHMYLTASSLGRSRELGATGRGADTVPDIEVEEPLSVFTYKLTS